MEKNNYYLDIITNNEECDDDIFCRNTRAIKLLFSGCSVTLIVNLCFGLYFFVILFSCTCIFEYLSVYVCVYVGVGVFELLVKKKKRRKLNAKMRPFQ